MKLPLSLLSEKFQFRQINHPTCIKNLIFITAEHFVKQCETPFITLTSRELTCLLFFLMGRGILETADILTISHKTVEAHMSSVKNKLNCRKKSRLFDMALQGGIFNYLFELLSKNT